MRVRTTIAVAAASGILLWASSPSVGAGWLAWIAVVPAAAAALGSPETRAARAAVPLAYGVYLELSLVPALPFGLGHNQWGEPLLPILVGDSPVVVVALVAVPLFALALYGIRFPHLVTPADRPGARAAATCVLVPALAWTALDLLRTKFDPSGLWGPLYLSQHDTSASGLAALAGPWLITFEIVAVGYAVALLLTRGRALLTTAALAGALALAPVPAAAALASHPAAADKLVVAAVQPGYDTSEFERPVLHYLRRAYRNHVLATRDLVADLAPQTRRAAVLGASIVVWPEATAWVEPRRTPVRGLLRRLAAETNATIVLPYFLRARGHGGTVAVRPDGTITRVQPKQRPMWFLGEDGGNRVPPRPVALPEARLGTLLGVDNQDPAAAQALAAADAQLLASSTHDWEDLAVQQRALSRLHAAALRLPVVRADWRYGSAVFDADGRMLADAGIEKRRAVVVAAVSLGGGRTLYARIGDVFGWAAVLAAAGVWIAGWTLGGIRRPASAG